jgi:uncharacterized protein YjbI with pentapeptide repeats
MKHRRWLSTLSGLLAGLILVQHLAQRRKPKPSQSRQATSAALGGKRRLTREDLLRMIEENSGPYDLDLSNEDLSELDLSIESVTGELEHGQRSLPAGEEFPFWMSKLTRGMRLVRASFHDATFRRANLKGANFWKSDLRGANLSLFFAHFQLNREQSSPA